MNILKKVLLSLLVIVILGVVFKDPLIDLSKPYVNEFMMTFPESEFKHEEIAGSYADTVCHNSHANFGESVRFTQSLDGLWDIAQGELNDQLPQQFNHKVKVPGFVTEAVPKFKDVGVESDEREAFWYKTSFDAPASGFDQSHLCLHKAKYGVKVWLNGQELGEHFGAFSTSEYDLTNAINYGGKNELVVRLGSEFTAIPEYVPIGADFEKYGLYPGLWDSVSLVHSGLTTIVRTKVEPNIDEGNVKVISHLKHSGATAVEVQVSQNVQEWNSKAPVASVQSQIVTILPGETKVVEQTVAITDAKLWSPESPFLYSVNTVLNANGQASDDRATRFGMRKFEWRSGEGKGFFLNNKRYYLRGTNIALHRFFEDQDRKELPWNREWVNELLTGHMKDFHWNSFRFHVGRAPNFWYDIADEAGLIVTDEYHIFAPVRLGLPGLPTSNNWSLAELEKEFTSWVQENWNHVSIGWWDASNENHNPIPYEAVPLVRHLDDTRVWDAGSYRAPDGANDPLEEHPYKLNGTGFMNSNEQDYSLADLDGFSRIPPMTSGIIFRTYDGEGAREHAYINNEYGWLWLTRDGTDATPIAENAYNLLAPNAELTAEQRREIYAYVVSELSGYWRARRGYAGIQHFLYLGKCSDKDTIPEDWPLKEPSATCDNFTDIPSLTMEPKWQFWAPHAFAPIGVNIEKWDEAFYRKNTNQQVPVSLYNDTYQSGSVNVSLIASDAQGNILAEGKNHSVTLAELEAKTIDLAIELPNAEAYVLYAVMSSDMQKQVALSRRKVGFEHPGIEVTLPKQLTSSAQLTVKQ